MLHTTNHRLLSITRVLLLVPYLSSLASYRRLSPPHSTHTWSTTYGFRTCCMCTLTMTHHNDRHAYFIQHWIAQMTYWKVNPVAQHWRTRNAPFFLLLLLLLLVLTCAHVVSGLSHTCRYLGYPIRMYVQGRHGGGGGAGGRERRLKHIYPFTLNHTKQSH